MVTLNDIAFNAINIQFKLKGYAEEKTVNGWLVMPMTFNTIIIQVEWLCR